MQLFFFFPLVRADNVLLSYLQMFPVECCNSQKKKRVIRDLKEQEANWKRDILIKEISQRTTSVEIAKKS